MSLARVCLLTATVIVACVVALALLGGGGAAAAPDTEALEGEESVIVTLESPIPDHGQVDPETLQTASEHALRPLDAYAQRTDGVTVERSFWLAPMALVSIDDEQYLEELADVPGVTGIYENAKFEPLEVETRSTSENTTWGLERIDVPRAWETYNTTGEGATVAVIDTGIDVDSHDDLELAEDGWAHFDWDGNKTDADPYDDDEDHGHGTHVSGTVVGDRLGGDGDRYGVAPNASLLHAGVQTDGSMTFAAVVSGMEWAIEHEADVDVITLSIGGSANPDLIEPVRNAQRTGVIVTAASGNNGDGTSSAPANIFESIAVGATAPDDTIAWFSSGETVTTSSLWGSAGPVHWPTEYLVPDVSAPGVDVCSALPDGDYGCYDGTSMATPHVAGVAALAVSADENRSPEAVEVALRETAWTPEGASPAERYGEGMVNATAVLGYEHATVIGTVTDADSGEPVSNAQVQTAGTYYTGSGVNGTFYRPTTPGEQEIVVTRVGYEPRVVNISPDAGETVTVNASLEPRPVDGQVRVGPHIHYSPGDTASAVLSVATVEAVTPTVEAPTDINESDVTITVDGEDVSLEETHFFVEPVTTDEFAVDIETDADAFGRLNLTLELEGGNATKRVPLGLTRVHDDPIHVGEDRDTESIQHAVDVAAPASTITVHDGTYEKNVSSGTGLVVPKPMTLAAAPNATPTIALSGDDTATGLEVTAETTLENLTVEAPGLSTGVSVERGAAGSTLSNLTVSGFADGVWINDSIAALTGGSITMGTDGTGVTVTEHGTVSSLAHLAVEGDGSGTGIDASGWVGALSQPAIANVSNGISLGGPAGYIHGATVGATDTGVQIGNQVQFGVLDSVIVVEEGIGIAVGEDGFASVRNATVAAEVGVTSKSDQVGVHRSHLAETSAAIVNEAAGEIVASLNYYGDEPRATDGTLQGPIRYGPFVTTESEVGLGADEVESFAYHLEVNESGQTIALPADSERSLEAMFGPVNGSLWTYDMQAGGWQRVTDFDRTPEALESFVVSIPAGERLTITVEPAATSTNRTVGSGWTLVGGSAYTSLENAIGHDGAVLALDRYERPGGDPARFGSMAVDRWSHHVFGSHTDDGPQLSPHGGYMLYSSEAGILTPHAHSAGTVELYMSAIGADSLGSTTESATLEEGDS